MRVFFMKDKFALVIKLKLILLFLMVPFLVEAREMTDVAGRTVRVPQEPKRVVSLAPSITELVYALDMGGILKGAVQFSNYPAQAKKLPRVGSYDRPDVERIVRLEPDLVLAIRDGNPKQVIDRLEDMDIPVFTLDSNNLEEIMQSITALGRVLDNPERAEELVQEMRERLLLVKSRTQEADNRPRVFFQADASPIIGAGGETFIDELIRLAGGENAISDKKRYPRLGWEDILRLNPDVAVIASMAGGKDADSLMRDWHRWPQLRAVQEDRVHVVDADLFERPTPRLLDGLEILARLIHPDLFAGEHEY
jgi:iron complex transport system substrate-binding protein